MAAWFFIEHRSQETYPVGVVAVLDYSMLSTIFLLEYITGMDETSSITLGTCYRCLGSWRLLRCLEEETLNGQALVLRINSSFPLFIVITYAQFPRVNDIQWHLLTMQLSEKKES